MICINALYYNLKVKITKKKTIVQYNMYYKGYRVIKIAFKNCNDILPNLI